MQKYFKTEQLITTCTIYESNHKTGVCTGERRLRFFREVYPLCQSYWYIGMKYMIREGTGRAMCSEVSTFYPVVMRLKQKSKEGMC